MYKSWNVTVRNTLKIDRTTHRYLVQPFSEHLLHSMVMIKSRLVEFYKSQLNSQKFCIRFLLRLAADDLRTVLGRSLNRIAAELKLDVEEMNGKHVKSKLKYKALPDDEKWRVPLGLELMAVRDEKDFSSWIYKRRN